MQTSNKKSLTCLSMPRNAGIFDSLTVSTLILFQGKGVQNPIRLTKVLLYSLKSLLLWRVPTASIKKQEASAVHHADLNTLGKFYWWTVSLLLWHNTALDSPLLKDIYSIFFCHWQLQHSKSTNMNEMKEFSSFSVSPIPASLFSLKKVESINRSACCSCSYKWQTWIIKDFTASGKMISILQFDTTEQTWWAGVPEQITLLLYQSQLPTNSWL